MNPIAVLPAAAGAVALYVGLWHWLIYRSIREREHLYFALTCLGVGLYDLAAALSYSGIDPFWGAVGQRSQHLALTLSVPALFWFVLAYTRHSWVWIPRLLAAYCTLQAVAILTVWDDWVLTGKPRISRVALPWGGSVVYSELRHGIILNAASLVYLLGIIALVYLTLRYLRSATAEQKPRARRLAVGMAIFLAGSANDLAVSNGLYSFLYVIEYAYVALVLVLTAGMSSSVIDLARTRGELKRSLTRLQRIFDSVEEVYLESTLDGRIVEISPSANRWVGPGVDLRGRSTWEFYADPADRTQVTTMLLRDGRVHDFESAVRLPDGRVVACASNMTLVTDEETGEKRIAGSLRDITEQKRSEGERQRIEQKMQQAQKLESLGVLAGGFAHDFNNLLTGIIGNAELTLRELAPSQKAHRRTQVLMSAARQAAELCRQMLAYSGQAYLVATPLKLNRLIGEMQELLKASVSKKAEVEYELAPDLPDVMADAAQLRQIVLNLAINASEAIGDAPGRITIRTRLAQCTQAELDSPYLAQPPHAGEYVVLEVRDTGCGMDAQARARLFDPFFTTKFSGRGLGLAAVLGIVRGHGGTILVESEPGKGSAFSLFLPVTAIVAAGDGEPASDASWMGAGCVLLADDEEVVREVGQEMLLRLGFDVLLASGGRAAVERFKADGARVTLALVDLTMPDLSGIDVARELRALRPELPILITSGYTEEVSRERFAEVGIQGFVAKPFTLDSLRRCLRGVVEGR